MRPFFDKDILTLVSREELQLMRRCISYRLTDWKEDAEYARNNGSEPNPEDLAEIKYMEKLYEDATKILEILPF